MLLGVEGVDADGADGLGLVRLSAHAAQDGFDAQDDDVHAEGLGDVVVGTDFETGANVFDECLGGEEDEGDVLVHFADALGQCESVHLGHHHVEDA